MLSSIFLRFQDTRGDGRTAETLQAPQATGQNRSATAGQINKISGERERIVLSRSPMLCLYLPEINQLYVVTTGNKDQQTPGTENGTPREID